MVYDNAFEQGRHGTKGQAMSTATGDLVDKAAAWDETAKKNAEIERLEKLAKELSDALLTVRPLGGSELFIQRGGKYYADPVFCAAAITDLHASRHRALKEKVLSERRAEAAESRFQAVRASTIEECAAIAKEHESTADDRENDPNIQWHEGHDQACFEIAEAIRTLATTEGGK